MSKFSPLAYIHSIGEQKLTHAQKMVLIQLALHANEHAISFPGVDRIARLASVSKRTVRDSLNMLEEGGIIKLVDRHGGATKKDSFLLLPLPDVPLAKGDKGDKKGDTHKPPEETTQSHAHQYNGERGNSNSSNGTAKPFTLEMMQSYLQGRIVPGDVIYRRAIKSGIEEEQFCSIARELGFSNEEISAMMQG